MLTVICISVIIFVFIYYIYKNKTIYNDVVHVETKKIIQPISSSEQLIQKLCGMADNVCKHCNFNPEYIIIETNDITHTTIVSTSDSRYGIIYLVLRKHGASDIFFCLNTLLYALLHEIAHIISPNHNHNHPFDTIEEKLLSTAHQLGYYDPTIQFDTMYKTLHNF